MTPGQKEEKSRAGAERMISLLKGEDRVLCYADLPGEMGTDELVRRLWDAGVRTAFPKVRGDRMDFYEIRSMDGLTPGAMGIREPEGTGRPVFWPEAPVITPGLAFDQEGGRAGYGAGYYDRFFAEEPDHPAVGFCFEWQITEEPLALDAHDRPMDLVVTECRIRRFRRKRGETEGAGIAGKKTITHNITL